MHNRVYYKLKKWKFESEYRTKKFWANPATQTDRQIKLPKEAFNRIILGNNISNEYRAEIERNVKENIGDIEIIKR